MSKYKDLFRTGSIAAVAVLSANYPKLVSHNDEKRSYKPAFDPSRLKILPVNTGNFSAGTAPGGTIKAPDVAAILKRIEKGDTTGAGNFNEPKRAHVVIADRALDGENAIRQRFAQQATLDKELIAAGCATTLKLSIGQPHLDPSPVRDLALSDLTERRDSLPNGYSPSKGLPQYVRYTTQLFNARNPGLDASDENVLFTNGGTGALATLASTLLQKGSKVLFPAPGFAAQMPALEGYGSQVIQVPTHDTGFKLTPERLEKILKGNPETAFVVLNDITNPTGAKYSEAELRSLGDVFKKNPNVLVFLDETYHDLALDTNAKTFLQVNPDLKNQVVIEYSTSKDIGGDPGLRGGMVYAPKVIDQFGNEVNLAEKMAGQQLNMSTAPSTLIQYLEARIIEAKLNIHYNEPTKTWEQGGRYNTEQTEWETGIKQAYSRNLTLAREQFAQAGMPTLLEPGGGFFLLIDAGKFVGREIPNEVTSKNGLVINNLHERVGGSTLDTDIKIANYLALVANMVTVEASPFGMPAEQGALRVSVANTPERLQEISGRINYADKLLTLQISQSRIQDIIRASSKEPWQDGIGGKTSRSR